MSDAGDRFFTSVGCMDGRVQESIAEFGKAKFGAEFPDTITEAGLVGKLASSSMEQSLIDSLKFKIVDVSVGKHHSKGVIVHGHQDCAGNPVDDDAHRNHVKKAAKVIGGLIRGSTPEIKVIPVFVEKIDGQWRVRELV